MKKVVIGSLVGALIFFVFQTIMWMGGFHNDFSIYTPNQGAIMQTLNTNLTQDGVYYMPSADWNAPNSEAETEKIMNESVGKPWAMVFYHTKMNAMDSSQMAKGFLYSLLACLLVAFVLYSGSYPTFGKRFAVSMCFSLFVLLECTFTEMNWWDFPWHYVKSTVYDMIIGWALVSLWFAWYVKEKGVK
ncbi:hypothetical protein [Flavobacterium sangjuense]|uniref:Uncharacterized protein n=1 Tax=Flavobacterium sangjuense TaxID=2518177 RepID=A0A4P7PU41_9FLAO|nr:hypothetical protein [Flavobacterium sangjuense]QBZ97810.1 hypothetical protein GS03_01308 [Flavobacterium sangjuense]